MDELAILHPNPPAIDIDQHGFARGQLVTDQGGIRDRGRELRRAHHALLAQAA
jgi:hypothetical protein